MRSFQFVLAAMVAAAVSAEVVDLTPENFDTFVGGDKPALVEFFAPWCGHCKQLAPEYDVVGTTFQANDGVVVAKVDADAHRDLGSRFGVSGFPTIKWFPASSKSPEDYSGGRTASDIVSFINGKTGLTRRVKKEPTAVTELTDANFDAIAMDPEADVLVEFFAPWCGHCKSLKPVYEKVASAFAAERKVVVAAVDATAARDVASRFEVRGYPTIKFFPRGSAAKEAEEYEGGRSVDDFVAFLNTKAGTHRTATGSLTAAAGRVEALDEFVRAFVAAAKEEREAIIEQTAGKVKELGEAAKDTGAYYVKAMRRYTERGAGWVTKESARLSNMATSAAVAAARKTNIMLRRNVLAAFEAVADAVSDAKDEL